MMVDHADFSDVNTDCQLDLIKNEQGDQLWGVLVRGVF